MSVIVDTKYLLLVSAQLLTFKKKTNDLWNFRCPYCNDSKKKESKARGYVYRKNNDLFFKCHNCVKGTTFSNFLKFLDPVLHKQYVFERFTSGDTHPNHNYKKPILASSDTKSKFEKKKNIYDIGLESIAELPDSHYAKEYIRARAIPIEHWNKLFYAPDFKKYVRIVNPEKAENLKDNDPRIVIPFFEETGIMTAIQGRALEDSVARYVTVKTYESSRRIYGLERINKNTQIWIFEGPFDSLFVKNGLAAAGSDLTSLISQFPNAIFVFDNEPHNKQITSAMKQIIDSGCKIVIWNKDLKQKDLNDMVLAGIDIDEVLNNSVYDGLQAFFKFNVWKKG